MQIMPKKRGKLSASATLAVGIVFGATNVLQAQEEPLWLQALKFQIAEEHNCTVNYFLNAHSYRLGDKRVFEARVICMDQRQFDASRTGEIEPFTIRSCEPVVC